MKLIVTPQGAVRCLYGETIDLSGIGRLSIVRGSHVESDDEGRWLADLAPVGGPRLGPFPRRSQALNAEAAWLEAHWLSQTPTT
jgi:hypothetical protein